MPAPHRFVCSVALAAIGAMCAFGHRPAAAEVELPRQSPPATVSQQVGLTSIVVEYSSPAVKGRKVWGAAVPYDKSWSMSPSQPTRIKFSRDVQVGGRNVPAGTYVLSAFPAKGDWTMVLTRAAKEASVAGKEPPAEGAHDAGAETDVIRFKAHAKPSPFRERLTFVFSDFNEEKATLDLEWEKVRVSIPIAVNTGQQVLAGIADLDSAWRSYANAARYMLETKKDFDAGLKYADQSLALKEDWYTYWIKASLLAAKLDWRGARENGEKAYALGQKLGDGFVLEYELRRNVADWTRRADAESKLTAR
jgi:hypothetical protein